MHAHLVGAVAVCEAHAPVLHPQGDGQPVFARKGMVAVLGERQADLPFGQDHHRAAARAGQPVEPRQQRGGQQQRAAAEDAVARAEPQRIFPLGSRGVRPLRFAGGISLVNAFGL